MIYTLPSTLVPTPSKRFESWGLQIWCIWLSKLPSHRNRYLLPDSGQTMKWQSLTNGERLQTGAYHHVTGVDASSSASLAAYVNTLTYNPHDKAQKVVSALYWCAPLVQIESRSSR